MQSFSHGHEGQMVLQFLSEEMERKGRFHLAARFADEWNSLIFNPTKIY